MFCLIRSTLILTNCDRPVLEPGGVYELPFLDTLITAEIPLEDRPQFHHRNPSNLSLHHELVRSAPGSKPTALNSSIQVLGGNPSPPLSFVFQHHLSSLWSLWELVALSEPILVFATSDVPSISAAVTWLSLLCRPIRYSGEHRPSINIHMHDYPRFVNSSPPLRALILGTTSPLVFSSCRHWPHILRLCSSSVSKMTSGSAKPDGVLRLPPPSHKHVNESRSFKASIEHRNGLFTGHRRTIKKDHAVLKQAEEKVKAGQYSQADALLIRERQHWLHSKLC